MPAGTALFGNVSSGPGSTGGNKHVIEMKAGKMNLKGHMVYPDKRKGLLYVYQSDDSLTHFCWQDRTTGTVEDDLIIFPDECKFVKIKQNTTGCVYLLKFEKSSNRKFFFWSQESSASKDDDDDCYCKRINEALNNPSSAAQSAHSQDQDLQSLLNNMSQSQLMQLFGGGVGQMGALTNLLGTGRSSSNSGGGGSARTSTPTAATHRSTVTGPSTVSATPKTSSNAAPPIQSTNTDASKAQPQPKNTVTTTTTTNPPPPSRAQMTNLLQNIIQNQPSPAGTSSVGVAQPAVDLSTALTSEALNSMLTDANAMQLLQDHLPAVGSNPQELLRSTVASPQFQDAVSQFSSALQSGQLAPIFSQLAVNPEAVAAASSGNMQEFVKALEKNDGNGKDDKPKDEHITGGDKTAEDDKEKKNDDKAKKNDDKNDDKMQLG